MANVMVIKEPNQMNPANQKNQMERELPQSSFIPSEKMPILIERILKIEKKNSGEGYFARKKRENRAMNQFYYMAVREGLNGQLKKCLKVGIMTGIPFCAVLTNFEPIALLSTGIAFGAGSFVAATLMTYRQIKEETIKIRKAILEKNIKQEQ